MKKYICRMSDGLSQGATVHHKWNIDSEYSILHGNKAKNSAHYKNTCLPSILNCMAFEHKNNNSRSGEPPAEYPRLYQIALNPQS